MKVHIKEIVKYNWHSNEQFIFHANGFTFDFGPVKKFRYNWMGMNLKLEKRKVNILGNRTRYLLLRILTQLDNETFFSIIVKEEREYRSKTIMIEEALHDLKNELLSISLGLETKRAEKRRDLVFKLFEQLN